MIYTCEEFTIFDNIDEATEMWDNYKGLKIWLDPTKKKLMITNLKGKEVSLTKTQLKSYDNPDVLLSKIKEHSGLLKPKKSASKTKTVNNDLQNIHNAICSRFNINPRDEHTPIRLICLLAHLAFENLTLDEFEKRVHTNYAEEHTKYTDEIDYDFNSSDSDEEPEQPEEQTQTKQPEPVLLNPKEFEETHFYDDVIKLIRDKDYSDILKQLIGLKEDFNLLLTQFRIYNGKKETNDTIETEPILCEMISKITLKAIEQYNINVKSVVEYCGGMGNLSKNFMKYVSKDVRFDVIEIIDEVARLNEAYNIANGIKMNVINANCIYTKGYNVGLLNPPYNEKILPTDENKNPADKKVLKFVYESIESTDITVAFFPYTKISTIDDLTTEFKTKILKTAVIPVLIKLGDKLFPGIGAGQIVVLVAINKRIFKNEIPEVKTRIFDFNTNNFIKKKIRGNLEWINKGEEEFNNMLEKLFSGNSKYHVNTLKLLNNIDWLKTDALQDTLRKIGSSSENSEEDALKTKFNKLLEEEILNRFINDYVDTKTFDETAFNELHNEFNEVIKNDIVKVRLMDYFDYIKGKGRCVSKVVKDDGKYNFISASKFNNGITGKCDVMDFEVSEEKPLYTITVNGSIGFIFKQTTPFSISQDVRVLKMINNLPNEKMNLILISLQLNNAGFGFSNKLTKERLNEVEVYIYKNANNPLKTKFNKLLEEEILNRFINDYVDTKTFDEKAFDKLHNEFNEVIKNDIVKVRLMDYFDVLNGKSRELNDASNKIGKYNFITCTVNNNGVGGKIDKYDYEATKEKPLYTIGSRGASSGNIYRQETNFCKTGSVFVLQNIKILPYEKFNLLLISIQLNSVYNTYTTYLTKNKLKDIEVYIYKNANNPLKTKFNKLLEEEILNRFINDYVDSKTFDETAFDNLHKEFNEVIKNDIVKVRLMDYFERIKGKSHNVSEFLDVFDGNYDLIGCGSTNNGIVKQINTYDFNEGLFTLSGLGAGAGYIFKREHKFKTAQNVHVLKRIKELPYEKFNLILISLQLNLSAKSFGKLKVEDLNDIEVYIYKN